MPVRAFRMQLKPGMAARYQAEHDLIWPELSTLLKQTGISDYAIYLDEVSLALFATLHVEDESRLATLADHPVMRRWWDQMAPLMETLPDNRPVEWTLRRVFHLP